MSWELVYQSVLLVLSSSVKFVFGPVGAAIYGYHWLPGTALTLVGMMLSVVLLSFGGQRLMHSRYGKYFKKKKLFSAKTRKLVLRWKKFGLPGVAFLTPIIFTPIGGTIIAVSFKEKPKRIIPYMLIAGLFWALLMNIALYYFSDAIKPYLTYFGIS